jgi:hypothetical protein
MEKWRLTLMAVFAVITSLGAGLKYAPKEARLYVLEGMLIVAAISVGMYLFFRKK